MIFEHIALLRNFQYIILTLSRKGPKTKKTKKIITEQTASSIHNSVTENQKWGGGGRWVGRGDTRGGGGGGASGNEKYNTTKQSITKNQEPHKIGRGGGGGGGGGGIL